MTKASDITDHRVWQKAYYREKVHRQAAEKSLNEKNSEVLTSLMILETQVKSEAEKNKELMEVNEKLAVAQSQLIQTEKMASIGQLSAGIAHEINNPLAFIRSYIQSLKEDWNTIHQLLDWYQTFKSELKKENQEKIDDYYSEHDIEFVRTDFQESLDECLTGVERIVEIVNQLQSYNRQGNDELAEIDMREPIQSAIKISQKRYRDEADIVFEAEQPLMIEGQPNQLSQVFLNLIINGIQATLQETDKGLVTIAASQTEDEITLSIKDNGSGISEENLKKIFDPFFTTKPVGLGTGLGMSVVYNILESHQAKIEVDSTIGKGTEFVITFPRAQGKEAEENPRLVADEEARDG